MFEGNPKKLSSILALYLLFSIVIFSVSLLMWTYHSTRYWVDQNQISTFDRIHSIAENVIMRQLELIDNALSKISGNEHFADAISNESLSVVRKIIDDFFCYDTGNQLDILFLCRSDNTVWMDASSQFFNPGPILQKIISKRSDIFAFGKIERFSEQGVDLTLLLRALPIVNNESGKVLGTLFGGTVLNDNLSILETIRQKSHSKAVFFIDSNDLIASTEPSDSKLSQLVLDETAYNCSKIFHIKYDDGKNMPQRLIGRCKPFAVSGISNTLNIVTATLDEVPASIRRSYLQTGMILIFFTLVFVFFSIFLIQKLTVSPLKSLLNYTDAISRGFFNSDYANGPIIEFNDVGHEMKRMVESLKNINELLAKDIEMRKKTEKEKLKLERQLRQAQKMEAIGTLAGGIAHDFNNILSAIIGFTELAQCESGSDEDSCMNEYLKEVLQAGKRAKELVKQILAFSRQSEQDIKSIPINIILKEALKLIRASLPSTIEIVQDIRDDVAIRGDPTQIHQVIMNLCTNAAHAMQDTGGILEIQLKLVKIDAEYSAKHVGTKPGSYINLIVSDTGHGMPSHVLERIFDPFFTTKKNGEGTGMGLAVVHGIIKSHGGFITAYSHPGSGSTFNIFLPALESVFEKEITEELPISGGNERILLVDDEPSITVMEKQMLESMGYHVRTQNSSTEALELFRSMPEAFDLVITDMTMPKMTGEQLSKELKAIRPEIPIILRTGFSAAINESMAMRKGISAYVMKPILRCDMARTIRTVLDRR